MKSRFQADNDLRKAIVRGVARRAPEIDFRSAQMARLDGIPDHEVLAHLRALVDATDLPINADYEDAFAAEEGGIARSVALAIEAGVAGLSIEDFSGGALLSIEEATERVRIARRAIDASGHDVMLIGRAEGLIRGRPDRAEAIARLQAYANAGADCLFAPGLTKPDDVRAVVDAVAPKPLNVVCGGAGVFSVAELAALGVRRISLGGGLARAAWAGFLRGARQLAVEGSFEGLAGNTPSAELNAMFVAD